MKTKVYLASRSDLPVWPYETVQTYSGVTLTVQASLRTSHDKRYTNPHIVHLNYKSDGLYVRVSIGEPTTGLVELDGLSCQLSHASYEHELDQLFDAGPDKTDPSNPVRALMSAGLFSTRTPGYLRDIAGRVVERCIVMADSLSRA